MLGETVTGLIDFYFACTDIIAYDVAVTHAAWCFDNGRVQSGDFGGAAGRLRIGPPFPCRNGGPARAGARRGDALPVHPRL
jgi:hypothetical protein